MVTMLKPVFHSKKGQFYILIALLLISYAFALSRQDAPVRKPKDTFQLLHEGYINEGAVAVNNAVYDDADVPARFANFTRAYMAFARSAEPGYRLAYLLKYKNQLVIGNLLGAELNATLGNSSYLLSQNEERIVQPGNFRDASLMVSGIIYGFSFSADDIQLKALFKTSDKLATRIFVQG